MSEEVGIIGQMYKNRKTNQVCVLESREEKYKTLMMRDKDGKSINVTYSTFRGNWRKYDGDELIQTSSQITEQQKKIEQKAEKAKENLAVPKEVSRNSNKQKTLYSPEDARKIAEDYASIVKNLCGELSLFISVSAKNGIMIKRGEKARKIIEVWPNFRHNPISEIGVFMKKDIWDEVVFDERRVGDVIAVYHEKWPMQYGANFDVEIFEDAMKDILRAVKEVYYKEDK